MRLRFWGAPAYVGRLMIPTDLMCRSEESADHIYVKSAPQKAAIAYTLTHTFSHTVGLEFKKNT